MGDYIDKLAKLGEDTTRGDWEVRRHEMPYKVPFEIAVHQDLGDTVVCWRQTDWQYEYEPQVEMIEADARFIAVSRNVWDELVAVVAAAEAYSHTTGTTREAVETWADVDDAIAALRNKLDSLSPEAKS